MVTTDDRGVYRVSLLPGEYVVMTALPAPSVQSTTFSDVARTGRGNGELAVLFGPPTSPFLEVGDAWLALGRGMVLPPPPRGGRVQIYPPNSTHRRHRSRKRRRCALVVVFTTDRSAWFLNSRRVVGIRTDGEGRYTIRNLPSGAYHVALAPDLDLTEWYDPSVLQTLVPTALPLTISGPDKSTVDLAIR